MAEKEAKKQLSFRLPLSLWVELYRKLDQIQIRREDGTMARLSSGVFFRAVARAFLDGTLPLALLEGGILKQGQELHHQ